VGVNGWLHFQTIGHLHSHAHHNATTHASPLCTLLCSAGQMAQFTGTPPPHIIQQTASIEPTVPTILLTSQATPPVSRGPPYRKPFPTIL
jgi:hypothetical protein